MTIGKGGGGNHTDYMYKGNNCNLKKNLFEIGMLGLSGSYGTIYMYAILQM